MLLSSASSRPESFVMIRISCNVPKNVWVEGKGGYREGWISSHGLVGTATLIQSAPLWLAMMTSRKLV